MKQIKSIQELINVLEEVPEENFIIGRTTDYCGKGCALGHINFALTGYLSFDINCSSLKLLNMLGVNQNDLVKANDSSPLGPKQGSLQYLKSLI